MTKKDKCKADDATLKTSRKKGVKDALKKSLGKDVTDVEVEKFIFEGAAVQVEEAMDGCMGEIDTTLVAGSQARKDTMKNCDDEAMETFKEARMYDGFEEATLDTEIAGVDSDINTYSTDSTALDTEIAGMATSTDEEKALKATKVAEKDAKVTAKAKTWADAKAKIEIAKTAGTAMTTKVFKEAQSTAAKYAFKSGLGVDAIGDEELEEMFKETSKMEMSKNLDACYDIAMTKDDSAKKGYLSNCRKEAMKTAKDARMPKKGSIEKVLETGIAGDIAEIAGMDAGTAKDAKLASKHTESGNATAGASRNAATSILKHCSTNNNNNSIQKFKLKRRPSSRLLTAIEHFLITFIIILLYTLNNIALASIVVTEIDPYDDTNSDYFIKVTVSFTPVKFSDKSRTFTKKKLSFRGILAIKIKTFHSKFFSNSNFILLFSFCFYRCCLVHK